MRTPFGQLAAHGDLLVLVEQRDLDAVDLGGVRIDDADARSPSPHVVGAAPVAGERGIEHLAQPVDDHRLAAPGAEHAVVDALVVGGRLGDARQRAAGHDDETAARLLDRRHLLLVGADHLVDGAHAARDRDGRCRSPRRSARGGRCAPPRPCRPSTARGSARARSASRGPCRAGRCPSPRPRRGPGPRGIRGRRSCAPNRPRSRARDHWRRARRPPRARPSRRRG